jgi:hypothetical protein
VLFAGDLSLPLGVAGPMLYVSLVLLSIWAPQDGVTWFFASLGTLLTALDVLLTRSGEIPWMVVTNRLLVVLLLWAAAVIVIQRRRFQQQQISASRRLADRITAAAPSAIYLYDLANARMARVASTSRENGIPNHQADIDIVANLLADGPPALALIACGTPPTGVPVASPVRSSTPGKYHTAPAATGSATLPISLHAVCHRFALSRLCSCLPCPLSAPTASNPNRSAP